MKTYSIDVSFERSDGFTFDGMETTVIGPRLTLPFGERTSRIEINKVGDSDWHFCAINFWGTSAAALPFINIWRTVHSGEDLPKTLGAPNVYEVTVCEIRDDLILLESTVGELSLNVGINFQVTIEDASGARWTSVDPQIISEKEPS